MNISARRSVEFLAKTIVASAAMTVSQRAEMLVTRRDPSDVPVRAFERLTGHRVHGTATRTVAGHLAQGSLAATAVTMATTTRGCPGAPAVVLIAASLVGGDGALAWILGLTEAPWRWRRRDLAIDVTHKTALAIAARVIVVRWPDRPPLRAG